MTKQPRLLPDRFQLDAASREAGRRGVAKARTALALARSGPGPQAADTEQLPVLPHPTAA